MAKRLSGDRNAVFAAILIAADREQPCPTNRELGRIGGGGKYFGSDATKAFVKQGLISIENFANARRVTVLATGKRTHYERGHGAPPEPEQLPRPVDRTPCLRCGTRKDIGCAHQQPDDATAMLTTFPHVRGLR